MDNAQHSDAENHPIASISAEADMAIRKNVQRNEGILRVIIGAFLIGFSFFLTGFWKPLSLIIGGLLVLTAIVAY